MRFKVILTPPTADVPVNNQHQMNGFIYAILGKNNEYHDKFSDYAISSLQGGKLDEVNGILKFNGEPFFNVSSENERFLMDFITGASSRHPSVFGMKIKRLDMLCDFAVHKKYDEVITISPIIVKRKDDMKLVYGKDEEWLELLTKNCKDKLRYLGIEDPTFRIEIPNPELAKEKSIWVGDTFNPCTMIKMVVYGKEKTRRAIYNLGFGGSTGSGFGSIEIYS